MNKLFLYGFLLIFGFGTYPIHTMQFLKQKISNLNAKKVATTVFVTGLTGIHYAISYPYVPGMIGNIIEKVDETEKVTPATEKFVKEELEKRGYVDFDRLKIIKGLHFQTKTTFSHDYFIFDSLYMRRIELILNGPWYDRFLDSMGPYVIRNMLPQKEYLKTVAGIIQHEGSHLINKDSHIQIKVSIGIICLMEIISMVLSRRFKPINNFWLKHSMKIPTGIVKGVCSLASYMAISRYIEQRADDGINDDVELLEAQRKNFQKFMGFSFEKTAWWNYLFFQSHPSDGDRFECFTRRKEKLEFEKRQATLKRRNL